MENSKTANGMKGIAIASMALGIYSIVGNSGGIMAVAAAVIALIFAYKVKKSGENYSFSTVGRVTAFVGLGVWAVNTVISFIAVMFFILYYLFIFCLVFVLSLSETVPASSFYEFESFVSNISMIL